MDNKWLTSSFEQLVAKRAFALQKEKKNFEVFFGGQKQRRKSIVEIKE